MVFLHPPGDASRVDARPTHQVEGPFGRRVIFRTLGEGQYALAEPDHGIEFTVDRPRRERGELIDELSVACGILGARVIDGTLSVGSFNFSSVQARSQRAKLLQERARTGAKLDWLAALEEVCQRVVEAERKGQSAVLLRTVQRPAADEEHFEVLGLQIPAKHPSCPFGDGGTFKSYLALKIASERAKAGSRVAYLDWELDDRTHRGRLEQINGPEMPDVFYVRCDKPLVYEVDRIQRIVRNERLDFAIYDSVGYGTDGAPESAEAAMGYCRAVRQIGIGGLLLAHVTKGENGDQRPFGSAFWHNSARSTWNIKLSNSSPDRRRLSLGVFNRKNNLGPASPPLGIGVQFDGDRVHFERVDVASIDDLAESLPLWQRMRKALSSGPQTL